MGEVVHNLKVRFGSNPSGFNRDMKKHQASMKNLSRQGTNAIERLAQSFGINTTAIRQGLDSVKAGSGAMNTGFRKASVGSNVLVTALKLLKIALISTGIGALVVALGSLAAYFTKTQRGADKLKIAFAGIKAEFATLMDAFSHTGEALTLIFSGKFKEGFAKIAQTWVGIKQRTKENGEAAKQLQRDYLNLLDREIQLTETLAERNKKIEEYRLKAKDEQDLTAKERLKAIQQAQALEKQNLADEMSMQRERVRILEGQQALSENMREDNKELAEAKAQLHDLEKQSLSMQRRLQTETNTLVREIEAETKAIQDLRAERQKELDDLSKRLSENAIPKVEIAPDLAPMKYAHAEIITGWEATGQVIVDATNAINDTMTNAAGGIAEFIGMLAIGEAGVNGFALVIGGAFADMAISVGKIRNLYCVPEIRLFANSSYFNPCAIIV